MSHLHEANTTGSNIPLEIISILTEIYEKKGRMSLMLEENSEEFRKLVDHTTVYSIYFSFFLSAIRIDFARLKPLALNKINPKTKYDLEVAGYRDALEIIHQNYHYIPLNFTEIEKLCNYFYKYTGKTVEISKKEELELLCDEYSQAEDFPLLRIFLFMLDFVELSPLSQGNRRFSRLLMHLLLLHEGFYICLYQSIEQEMEIFSFDEAEPQADLYLLNFCTVLLSVYQKFEFTHENLCLKRRPKPDSVEKTIKSSQVPLTKRQLVEKFPNISEVTIQRSLADLLKQNKIEKIGGGRYTSYRWKEEKS